MNNLSNEEQAELDAVDQAPPQSEQPEETQAQQPPKAEPTSPQNEEIKFQRIMDYKAYRRGMKLWRCTITLIAAVALAMLGFVWLFLGVVGALTAVIVGAISILASLNNEQTYNVYNTRVVIKRRGDDKRKSVPFENIVSVKYKSAFYEKRKCVGTVTIFAKNDKGKVKKYKLKHIFDAMPVVEYINGEIKRGNNDGGSDSE